MSKPKVFISYSDANYADVIKISTMLKEHNINTFVAKHDIKSGEKWSNKIKDSLKTSHVFLAIITKEYHNSSYADPNLSEDMSLNAYFVDR